MHAMQHEGKDALLSWVSTDFASRKAELQNALQQCLPPVLLQLVGQYGLSRPSHLQDLYAQMGRERDALADRMRMIEAEYERDEDERLARIAPFIGRLRAYAGHLVERAELAKKRQKAEKDDTIKKQDESLLKTEACITELKMRMDVQQQEVAEYEKVLDIMRHDLITVPYVYSTVLYGHNHRPYHFTFVWYKWRCHSPASSLSSARRVAYYWFQSLALADDSSAPQQRNSRGWLGHNDHTFGNWLIRQKWPRHLLDVYGIHDLNGYEEPEHDAEIAAAADTLHNSNKHYMIPLWLFEQWQLQFSEQLSDLVRNHPDERDTSVGDVYANERRLQR